MAPSKTVIMDANAFSFTGMLIQSGNRAFNTGRDPQSSNRSLGKCATSPILADGISVLLTRKLLKHYSRKKEKTFYLVLSNNLESFLYQSNLVPLSCGVCMCLCILCLCLNSVKPYSAGWHHVVSLPLHHKGLKIYEWVWFLLLAYSPPLLFGCFSLGSLLHFSHFWIQIFEVHGREAVICMSACVHIVKWPYYYKGDVMILGQYISINNICIKCEMW